MALLYIGTALDRKGIKVNLIDGQVEDPGKRLKSVINDSDFIGFSVMTSQVQPALELSDFVKDTDPDVPVVWGGIHPSLFPGQVIKDPSVDYVVYGEGEQTLLELAEYFDGNKKLSEIKGLIYQDGETIKTNPERHYIDINSLSPPNWNLLKMKEYIASFPRGDFYKNLNYERSLPVHTGRGCVHRCTFCVNTIVGKRKWRPLSVENILNEVSTLTEKYNLDHINFVDENFFIDKRRNSDFAKRMLEEKIDIIWSANCKVSYFNETHLNDEMVGLLKKSGCMRLCLGMESGSQRILDKIKKDITVEQIINAVKKCDQFGIMMLCNFMVGMPGETKADIRETLSLIRKIRDISPFAFIGGPVLYRPYPGGELYDEAKKLGYKEPKTLRDWANVRIFTSSDAMPWIDDFNYIEAALFYIRISQSKSTNKVKSAIKKPFGRIADFRLEHDFYGFQYDKKFFEFAEHLYNKLKLYYLE